MVAKIYKVLLTSYNSYENIVLDNIGNLQE